MKVNVDSDGMVSQRQAGQMCGVSQQRVNFLVRSGRISAKPDGRIRVADLANELVLSQARKGMGRAEFAKAEKAFRAETRQQRIEGALEALVREAPNQARAILGGCEFERLRVEFAEDEGEK